MRDVYIEFTFTHDTYLTNLLIKGVEDRDKWNQEN